MIRPLLRWLDRNIEGLLSLKPENTFKFVVPNSRKLDATPSVVVDTEPQHSRVSAPSPPRKSHSLSQETEEAVCIPVDSHTRKHPDETPGRPRVTLPTGRKGVSTYRVLLSEVILRDVLLFVCEKMNVIVLCLGCNESLQVSIGNDEHVKKECKKCHSSIEIHFEQSKVSQKHLVQRF